MGQFPDGFQPPPPQVLKPGDMDRAAAVFAVVAYVVADLDEMLPRL